ncbi:MAG: hypothetical protein IJN34_06055 [Clostridia bacterium]|nr:hypothetical protein [Clostridia bacterium]
MNKKCVFILLAIGAVVLCLLAFVAFYAVPFVRGNNIIVHVNQNGINAEVESDWITNEDLKLMQIVDNDLIREDTYTSIKTKTNMSWISWNKISIIYDITANVKNWDDNAKIVQCDGKREMIFVFSDFKWIVEKVADSPVS